MRPQVGDWMIDTADQYSPSSRWSGIRQTDLIQVSDDLLRHGATQR